MSTPPAARCPDCGAVMKVRGALWPRHHDRSDQSPCTANGATVEQSDYVPEGMFAHPAPWVPPPRLPPRKGRYPEVSLGDSRWDQVIIALNKVDTLTAATLARQIDRQIQHFRRASMRRDQRTP